MSLNRQLLAVEKSVDRQFVIGVNILDNGKSPFNVVRAAFLDYISGLIFCASLFFSSKFKFFVLNLPSKRLKEANVQNRKVEHAASNSHNEIV